MTSLRSRGAQKRLYPFLAKVNASDGINPLAVMMLVGTVVISVGYFKLLLDTGRYAPKSLEEILTETKAVSNDEPNITISLAASGLFPTHTAIPTRVNPRLTQIPAADMGGGWANSGLLTPAQVNGTPTMTFTWAWRTYTYTPTASPTITNTPSPAPTNTPAPVREIIVTRVIDVAAPPVFITVVAPAPAPVIVVQTEVIYVPVVQTQSLPNTETPFIPATDAPTNTPELTPEITQQIEPTNTIEPTLTITPISTDFQ